MGSGLAEMFNRTLLNMLGTLEDHQKADWKSRVPVLAHAYKSTCHESTGYAPHYLIFGRYPRLAVDAFLDIKPDSEPNNKTAYVLVSLKRLEFAYNTTAKGACRQGHRHKKSLA